MHCTPAFLSYSLTGFFSKIILDYINQENLIQPFFKHAVSMEGMQASIAARKSFPTNRQLLVTVLQEQYEAVSSAEKVIHHIRLLKNENTFTVCTAHQPNIFTGHLYFVFKILHTVKLAEQLKTAFPQYDFVPVYYMGSEDADLDELGHIFINGEKHQWITNQTGAVGRMKVDKALVKLIDALSGQLQVQPFGGEIIAIMKDCYREGVTIEQATFQLVHQLFSDFGVVTVMPDNAALKASFIPIIERELTSEFSDPAVQATVSTFPTDYKVQASGRALNMFYLLDDKRERIERENEQWVVLNTELKFNREQIIEELNQHPERFSPNVILRPVFQEWILPNIAFIGGGGEIAYWLQLKKVFESAETPYPLLVVRNSFMVVSREMQALVNQLGFTHVELFSPAKELFDELVKKESTVQLSLEEELLQLNKWYQNLGVITGNIDITLQRHTSALQAQAIKKIISLEKKMLRAEKKKFEARHRQLIKVKAQLFPNNNLQERVDNLMPYYAKWGKAFIREIYTHSKGLEHEFGILTEQ